MFKKRLIIGSVTLALLVLFALTGCSSPTGSDGPQGPRGQERIDGDISPEQLAELFTIHDQIRVVTTTPAGATAIAGIVPAGKTLEISGEAAVTDPRGLTINGTVHIFPEGRLNATGALGTGTINRGSTGRLVVDGTLEADDTFFDNGIPQYVTVNPSSAVIVVSDKSPGYINYLFDELNIPAVDINVDAANPNFATGLTSANLAVLTAWDETKTLFTRGAQTYTSGTVDLTGKGKLIITGAVTLGVAATTTGATIKASDSGVIVSETGSIELAYGSSSLVGSVTINGGLTVVDMTVPALGTGDPERLPASVDLSGATITARAGSKLVLPATAKVIGGILPAGAVEIIGATSLDVGFIRNTATANLTLPAIPVTAASVEIVNTGSDLTITAPTGATLSPDRIIGDGNLDLTASAIRLAGPIELGTTIILNNLDNLGTAEGIYTQLAQITGGAVNAGALVLDFISGVYNTAITTTGAATFKGDTTFNRLLTVNPTFPAIVTVSDPAPVSITLNADAAFTGLTHTSTAALTIKGSGNLTIGTSGLVANEIVFDNKKVLLTSTATTPGTFNGKLTVGPNASVTLFGAAPIANNFVFGPGVYTPGTGGFTFVLSGSSGQIALAAADGSIALGELAADNLTLKNTVATQTYTATTGTITLSGKDNGAIVVAAGATLTPSGDVDITLGKGAIVLAGTNSNLAAAGYDISGFTAHRGEGTGLVVQTTINDQTSFIGTRVGTYYGSGITITPGVATYEAKFNTDHEFTQGVLTTGAGNIFAAAGAGGGIITRDSDIIE